MLGVVTFASRRTPIRLVHEVPGVCSNTLCGLDGRQGGGGVAGAKVAHEVVLNPLALPQRRQALPARATGMNEARTSSRAPPGYHFLPQPCMLFSFQLPLKMLRAPQQWPVSGARRTLGPTPHGTPSVAPPVHAQPVHLALHVLALIPAPPEPPCESPDPGGSPPPGCQAAPVPVRVLEDALAVALAVPHQALIPAAWRGSWVRPYTLPATESSTAGQHSPACPAPDTHMPPSG